MTNDSLFVSKRGWSINLPAGWTRMSSSELATVTLSKPEVFADQSDWNLALTWMQSVHQSGDDVRDHFKALTATAGELDKGSALLVIEAIFPLIGQLERAEAVTLADGRKALESVECFASPNGDELQRGYQLVVMARLTAMVLFERLCFYAPASEFDRNVDKVRQAARSIRVV